MLPSYSANIGKLWLENGGIRPISRTAAVSRPAWPRQRGLWVFFSGGLLWGPLPWGGGGVRFISFPLGGSLSLLGGLFFWGGGGKTIDSLSMRLAARRE